jgi:type IV pilus assembly protein PilV
MAESVSLRKSRRQRGFTLIETMVAIMVLSIGLVATAALMSTSVSSTSRSHYMSTASMLASEKLEDLDRYNANDSPMAAGGSLTGDAAGYFDDVQISTNNGNINETTTQNGVTTVYTQQPGGNITVTQNASLPAPTPDTLTFDRRWLITQNSPVNGVRTITVLVTLTNQSLKPPVTFEMSEVRP